MFRCSGRFRVASFLAVPLIAGACSSAGIDSSGQSTEVSLSREESISGRGGLTEKERLGKHLFFDENLSEPRGQACATCHSPSVGFTGPSSVVNATIGVYPGAVPTRFGNRKPPTAAYAPSAPLFSLDPASGAFHGGNFWDGRATGEKLGNPAADQAQGPFLNPLEQNNPDAATVVAKVCKASYASLFLKVWGSGACADAASAYDFVGQSIAAYEASREVSAFSSKYDAWVAGRAALSAQEERGRILFEGRAMCVACHAPPLFTDFTYDNLGIPRNPLNPFYFEPEVNTDGLAWTDPGLAGFLATRTEWSSMAGANRGKQKVPTLRNVDKRPFPSFVKAYAHNGYFKSLKAIIHFYNTRDVLPVCPADYTAVPGKDCWPAPEVPENLNRTEIGNLGLTSEEEDDLVAFLATLSDGYRAGGAE
jgi:cytochrome c peroxidase